jgi:uncharacterized damage-inducible protein DinB
MREAILHMAHYGRWANLRVVQRLEQLPASMLDEPVPGSFPTLRATLLHIRDAENVWYCRIQGLPFQWPAGPSLEPASLITCSDRLCEWVEQATDSELQRTVEYRDLKGNMYQQPVWQLLLHCFNHATQHRGQLITQLRASGVTDIPANDLVVFQRSLLP